MKGKLPCRFAPLKSGFLLLGTLFRGEVGAVEHIPTEGFEEEVEEFLAELGLVVATGAVELARVAEAVDEILDDGWCGHIPP